MPDILTPDICVIGAGSGGLTTAAAAAAFGVEVVLIERGAMGGDCLNFGCVPSKSLLAAARHADAIRRAPRFGVSSGDLLVDFAAVKAHVDEVVASIAPHDSVERFEALGVTVLKAGAEFVDERTVSAGGRLVRPRRFVIAAGSSPRIPAIEGLSDTPYLTNETVFGLVDAPSHLVVLGGGPIGLEIAQAHRRLGAKVTVLEAARALGREDRELAAVVLSGMRAEGIEVVEGAEVVRVAPSGGGVAVTWRNADGRENTVRGSHLFLATGRTPNTAGLGLAAAGIDHNGNGIRVGRNLRTSNRRVYAIGDIAGGPQFTHVAGYHGGLVLRGILFRLPFKVDHDTIPHVTFTDPELGQVGLTEADARSRGLSFDVLSWLYLQNDRARAERRTEGLVKLVVGKRGRLLGAGVVGAAADEMTNLFALALRKKMTVADLRDFVSPYPTFSEIGKRAATAYYAPYATKPAVRRAIAFMRRFG